VHQTRVEVTILRLGRTEDAYIVRELCDTRAMCAERWSKREREKEIGN